MFNNEVTEEMKTNNSENTNNSIYNNALTDEALEKYAIDEGIYFKYNKNIHIESLF